MSRAFHFRRKQRVRFRPRYAGSLLRSVGKGLWLLFRVAVVGGAVAWAGVAGMRYWKTSSSLRVKSIVFAGDVPAALRASFPVKPNENLFLIHPRVLEKDALQKFPELRTLSVRRALNRDVIVTGAYRVPVARSRANGRDLGVDANGELFPLSGITPAPDLPTIEAPYLADRQALVRCLDAWKKHAPKFNSLVKKLETDRMGKLSVEMTDDVLIDWDELELDHVVDRAEKILKLRAMFEPKKFPATLKFVTDDRIVLSANWAKKAAE
jgi:cell division septal protein FtsQ